MTCYSPLRAYRSRKRGENGKWPIVFRRQEGFEDMPVLLPCGNCIGCRLQYSAGWALRCVNEAQLYQDNCFVTLTYNNENLPKDGELIKRDLQLFHKRLRQRNVDRKIRHFSCGELGSLNRRPHYHTLLFNYKPQDLVPLRQAKFRQYRGRFHKQANTSDLYTSAEVLDLWHQKGFVTIGDVGFKSAGYVARYSLKKMKGPKQEPKQYTPFSLMSLKPGIGKEWIEKYWNDIYPKDFVMINGYKRRPPRYYDEWLKDNKPDIYLEVKQKRLENYENRDLFLDEMEENKRQQYVKHLKVDKQLIRRIEQ